VLLGGAGLLEPNELGDVVDRVQDVGEPPVRPQDRRVDRGPVAGLEAAALDLGPPDVVLLHGHGVGGQGAPDPVQGRPQVALAGGFGVVGVVGEDLEQARPRISSRTVMVSRR
jgi:hypothetical protein